MADVAPAPSVPADVIPTRPKPIRQFVVSQPLGTVGLMIILVYVACAFGAPLIAPFNPEAIDFLSMLTGPGAEHWFGTDQYGRDVFSRVLHGGRSALLIAASATAFGLLLGSALGTVAAYYGGKVDEILMRASDALLSFPSLLLAMLILSMAGPNVGNLVVGIAVVFSPRVARVMRAVVLGLRTKEFVEAARLRGESDLYIMAREILPNAVAPLVVEGSIRLSYAILLVGTLGFLGLGVQPPSPDWGLSVAEARNVVAVAPWLVAFPSAAIASLVVGANLLADAVHRALDPASVGLRPAR